MKKLHDRGNGEFRRLRANAEKALNDMTLNKKPAGNADIKSILQELQVHQLELEMQNDELRLVNIELEKQRGQFLSIYELAPVGYCILDDTGIVKDVNSTGKHILHARMKSSIINKPLQNFIAAEDSDTYYKFFMRILRSRGRQRCQLRLKQQKETVIHVQMEGVSRISAEEPVGCYIAIVDISERIRAEQEHAEVKERLELSLLASLAGTWELDLKTMRFFVDDSSRRICNMPGNSFFGNLTDFINLIHPDDQKDVEQKFNNLINKNSEIDLICRFGRPGDKDCYTVIRGHMITTPEPGHRLAGIIMDITEKTQMEKYSLQLKKDNQKKIAAATLNTEENERKRISGMLHDSVSQLLYAIKIKLGQVDKGRPTGSEINTINKLLDRAIEETRNVSFELAPSILTDFGLPATVEELVKRLSSKNLQIKYSFSGFFSRPALSLEINIYRIVQELVNNVMKHASASHLSIGIHKNTRIEIVVQDNGKGFDVNEQENSTAGSGLSSIKNRLSLYNGSLTINSTPGQGTTVHVVLYENPDETVSD